MVAERSAFFPFFETGFGSAIRYRLANLCPNVLPLRLGFAIRIHGNFSVAVSNEPHFGERRRLKAGNFLENRPPHSPTPIPVLAISDAAGAKAIS
jgi:hypothetical protein